MSTRHVTCRYFIHGVCREGSNCMFSHDLANSRPSAICKFYQKGLCSYGERCRYDHVKLPVRGARGTDSNEQPVRGWASGSAPPRKQAVKRDSGGHAGAVSWSEGTPPNPQSYLAAIKTGLDPEQDTGWSLGALGAQCGATPALCPYAAAGQCFHGDSCPYLHGDPCDVCGRMVLHPLDPAQRKEHRKKCLQDFEADMEKAFAAQLSEDKVCSICMEVVVQKIRPSERRFGILSSCCHTFCLSCIRQWRCTRTFQNQIVKSCPECRIISEFVIPSVYWVEDQNEKNQLIELFKSEVGKKACRFFDQGRGACPFGAKCLYRHAFPDGSLAEPDKPRKQLSSEGSVRFMNRVSLWDFIQERDQHPSPHLPHQESDITELQELFMQMSGPSQVDSSVEHPDRTEGAERSSSHLEGSG
ncbi:E3 ubiquitin-protein ligase makorin-2 [Synchiropus picturatus]